MGEFGACRGFIRLDHFSVTSYRTSFDSLFLLASFSAGKHFVFLKLVKPFLDLDIQCLPFTMKLLKMASAKSCAEFRG